VAVALPQLLELLAADFLVDFLEDIGHELFPPQPRLRIPTPGRSPISLLMWQRQGRAAAGPRS
jgi:hypothetical protein